VPTYADISDVQGDTHIDSRDLIELRDRLEAELLAGTIDQDHADDLREAIAAIDGLEECGLEDWGYGAHLIREDYFEDYARELAEDIGAIDRDANWPLSYIDWPAPRERSRWTTRLSRFWGRTTTCGRLLRASNREARLSPGLSRPWGRPPGHSARGSRTPASSTRVA